MDSLERKPAAMHGGGFYNLNSSLQAVNLLSALPLLEDAVRSMPVCEREPVVLVDYGSSQGRNSLLPMRAAIGILRSRVGESTPIEIFHADLPSNDFTSLFVTLDTDSQSYLATAKNVFPFAVGRSYFEPILAPGKVDLGWSSNALHWMSRNPVDVPDHGWAIFSSSMKAREAVDKVLAEDWRRFLAARSTELKPGARLVCQFLGRGPETHGFEWMAGLFWQCLSDMGRDGLLNADELLRMTNPSAGRSIEQIRAPFQDGVFEGLSLVHVSIAQAPDPFWDAYRQSGDATGLGRSWAMTMRAANGPNFSMALDSARSKDVFLDELTGRLTARVAANPQRSESYMMIVVLEKIVP
jgi:SAM-dependent methyltransferase